jgi:hypothetical protein
MEDRMNSPYTIFKTDKGMESDKGITLDYGDFKIQIARAGGANKKFSRLLTSRMKPYKRQMDTDTMDESVATKIMVESYTDAVILGWASKNEDGKFVEGIHNQDGDIVDYNRENVIETLTNLPDLFRDIQSQADKISNFRIEEIEDIVKNSPAV